MTGWDAVAPGDEFVYARHGKEQPAYWNAGVFALPVDLVSRLELAWVADVLAQDLISEFVDSPSGSEYEPAADPT